MKKATVKFTRVIALMLAALLIFTAMPLTALADSASKVVSSVVTDTVKDSDGTDTGTVEDLIESEHPYADNCDESWTIYKEGANRIAITFSEDTCTESGFDYIEISDANGNTQGNYSGSSLAGERVFVLGDTVNIRLTSDDSNTEYGFALTNVEVFYDECTHTETELKNAYDADCEYSGYTGDEVCNGCGVVLTYGESIDPLGHSFDDSDTCTVCGESVWEYGYNGEGTIVITGYNGNDTEIEIPSVLEGVAVTEIGFVAFSGQSRLTSIIIPNSVTTIGDAAFNSCSSLVDITIPSSVTSIGEEAFAWCTKLESIELPNSVKTIDLAAFAYCSALENITLNGGLTTIGEYAFRYCTSLKNITIPDSVTTIGYEVFYECNNLKDVFYTGTEEEWNAVEINENNEYLFNATIHYEVGADHLGEGTVKKAPTCALTGIMLYTCACGYEIEGIIPATGHSFTDDICDTCGVNKADLIESEHPYADNCDESWTIYKEGAKRITITFSEDTYTESCDYITILDSKGNEFFSLSADELAGKRFTVKGDTVVINLTSDGSVNYYGFALSNVEVFYEDCAHTETEVINDYDAGCDYYGYTGDTYCAECGEMLESGKEIAPLGHSFDENDVCTVCSAKKWDYEINDDGESITIYGYNGNETEVEIPSEFDGVPVTIIYRLVFSNLSGLTSVIIPDSVTTIEGAVFSGCTSLKSIDIPDSVTSIGNSAFSGCESLTSIDIPDRVTNIGSYTFRGCYSLESVTLPEGVISIGEHAFDGCEKLTSIDIPTSVTSMGRYAFGSCYSLESINIPDGVTSIDNFTFYACFNLKSITISDNLNSIGEYAFYACESLTNIALPESLTSIGDSAFVRCDDLALVMYGGTEEEWNSIAIADRNDLLLEAYRLYETTSVSSVEVTTEPDKLTYIQNVEAETELDITGGIVTVTTDNGELELPLALGMTSGFDQKIVGEQTITVTIAGKTDTFTVTVEPFPIDSIEIEDVTVIQNNRDDGYLYDDGYFHYEYYPECTVNYSNGDTETISYYGSVVVDGYWYDINIEDGQSEETPWGLGEHTVTATLGTVSTTFTVTVVPSPITDITVNNEIVLYENYDGYKQYEWNEETYENDLEWFEYEISYRRDLDITVTFADDTTQQVTRGDDFDYEDHFTYFEFNTDQSYENQWGLGTHTGTIEMLGYSEDITVTVVESPVESFSVKDITIYADDNGGAGWLWYMPEFTVNYENGDSVTITDYENGTRGWDEYYVTYYIGENLFRVDYDDSQEEDYWTAGTYTVTAHFMGLTDEFTVTVKESPIISVEVEDFSVYKNLEGGFSTMWDEETGEIIEYWAYDTRPEYFTVTFVDGTSGTYSVNDGVWYGDREYNLSVNDGQTSDNVWGVGDHTATAEIGGVETTYTVTVVESPVESIEFEDVTTYEGEKGQISYEWNEETGEYDLEWFRYHTSSQITVTFTDGSVYESYDSGFYYEGIWYYPDIIDDQSYENQWGIGKHTVTARFGNAEYTYTVNVLESPIKDITINGSVKLIENVDGSVEYYDGEEYFAYSVYPGDDTTVTVTLSDGSEITIAAFESLELDGEYYSLNYYSNQNGETWGLGTHYATVSLLGKEVTYPVEVIKNPVKSITVDPIKVFKEVHAYYIDWDEFGEPLEQGYYYYEPYNLVPGYTVTFENGDTQYVAAGENFELNGRYYWMEVDDHGQSIDNQWQTGNTYTVTGTVVGVSVDYEVEIIENPIESITIKDIFLTENTGGFWEKYYNEDDELIEFYFYEIFDYDTVITLKDGTVVEDNIIYGAYLPIYNHYFYMQQYENPFVLGKNTCEVYLGECEELSATVNIYIHCKDADHAYDHVFDTDCNRCGLERVLDVADGLYELDGKLAYIVNGKVNTAYNALLKYEGVWYYVKAGYVPTGGETLVKHSGVWYYVKNGLVDFSYTGLVKYSGTWYYVSGGKMNTSYEGLVKYSGSWYYVKSGKLQSSYTGLVKHSGTWYYVSGGKMNTSYAGLTKYSGTWYYVSGGKINTSYAGLTKYSGTWYYVSGGKMNTAYAGLVKYGGTWYYVSGGKMNTAYAGLVKHGGIWYYVSGGKINTSYTGLVNYGGATYYVSAGKMAASTTGLVKVNGTWYYIVNGKVAANTTTLVKYSGKWYYVAKGKVDFTYSGKVLYSGKYYTVKNGVKI